MNESPTALRGCGCAKVHIPSGQVSVFLDGITHRYSRPCYSTDKDGERHYLNLTARPSLLDRMAALEEVVAKLVAERTS